MLKNVKESLIDKEMLIKFKLFWDAKIKWNNLDKYFQSRRYKVFYQSKNLAKWLAFENTEI